MTKGDEEAGGRGRYCSVKCNCWKMETNQNVLYGKGIERK